MVRLLVKKKIFFLGKQEIILVFPIVDVASQARLFQLIWLHFYLERHLFLLGLGSISTFVSVFFVVYKFSLSLRIIGASKCILSLKISILIVLKAFDLKSQLFHFMYEFHFVCLVFAYHLPAFLKLLL